MSLCQEDVPIILYWTLTEKHIKNHTRDINFRYSMSYNGEIKEIQKVTSEKVLEVIVDNKLIFREHIGKDVGIANRNLYF